MRDLTKKQFLAALKRNDFAISQFGYGFVDLTDPDQTIIYGGVVDAQTFNLLRRTTLACLIQQRKRYKKANKK